MRVRLLRNRRGFTIIEALVVMSILGVVATFAVPAFERTMLANKLDRATVVAAADLQNAFTLAARQRKPVRVTVDGAGRSIEIYDRTTGALLTMRRYGASTSAYGLTSLSIANPVIVFPTGIASGTTTVTLRLGQHQRRITMSRVGQIRIQVL